MDTITVAAYLFFPFFFLSYSSSRGGWDICLAEQMKETKYPWLRWLGCTGPCSSKADHLQHDFCARGCMERCSSGYYTQPPATLPNHKINKEHSSPDTSIFARGIIYFPITLSPQPSTKLFSNDRGSKSACVISFPTICAQHTADPHIAALLVVPLWTSFFLVYPLAAALQLLESSG